MQTLELTTAGIATSRDAVKLGGSPDSRVTAFGGTTGGRPACGGGGDGTAGGGVEIDGGSGGGGGTSRCNGSDEPVAGASIGSRWISDRCGRSSRSRTFSCVNDGEYS